MDIDGVFAFSSVEDMMKFLIWVVESFRDEQEFLEWASAGKANDVDSQFWSIINHEYSQKGRDVSSTD